LLLSPKNKNQSEKFSGRFRYLLPEHPAQKRLSAATNGIPGSKHPARVSNFGRGVSAAVMGEEC
jgi:hypothetical protein